MPYSVILKARGMLLQMLIDLAKAPKRLPRILDVLLVRWIIPITANEAGSCERALTCSVAVTSSWHFTTWSATVSVLPLLLSILIS